MTQEEIDELVKCLRWYVQEDDINEGDPGNQTWIDGKRRAEAILAKVDGNQGKPSMTANKNKKKSYRVEVLVQTIKVVHVNAWSHDDAEAIAMTALNEAGYTTQGIRSLMPNWVALQKDVFIEDEGNGQ